MSDTDFDFDFDVNRGRSEQGTSPSDEPERPRRRRPRHPEQPEPESGAPGDGADGGNGTRTNGAGVRGLVEDARRRGGNGSGANGGSGAPPVREKPPLTYRDDEPPGDSGPFPEPEPFAEPEEFPPPRTPRSRRFRSPRELERDQGPARGRDDDWFDADDGSGEDGFASLPDADDGGPAGPPTPGEGRALAREARKRVTGGGGRRSSALLRDDLDFEQVLERQPQKSGIARRKTSLLYGFREIGEGIKERAGQARELLHGGRERLRDGRERISALREHIPTRVAEPVPGGAGKPPPPSLPRRIRSRRPGRPKPGQIKKLRLLVVLAGLGLLAGVSMVFGMMMSIAGNLPELETKAQYAEAKNSEVYDVAGRKIGTLLSNNQRILVESDQISPYMKQAAVAIEDQRFYEHRGVDFVGIGRALVADIIPGGSTQGASTITQQFVKNALEAQGTRSYFQKLREAAYAYHLERKWDKDKIITEYLNTIYFGEGAYGVEAAARTYFGYAHPGCGQSDADSCASELAPEEAALLAGIISAPGASSPRATPQGATERRNLVLEKMKDQGVLSEQEYTDAVAKSVPAPSEIEKPKDDSLSPYFTNWLRQQVVDRYGAGRAFGGGLDVHTTIDLDMQEEAEAAAYDTLAGVRPTASVVVIDNATGAVRALVGGNNYEEAPFNLATNGHRQPGSSFKPFILATALQQGISPGTSYSSNEKLFDVPDSKGKEFFPVHNYEDQYLGSASLQSATTYSDNSVYAELALGKTCIEGCGGSPHIRGGTAEIAKTAEAMGIRTDVSENPAMVLGAPDEGFTPLEMAYAFTTLSHDGERVGGTLDTIPGNKDLDELGPVAIEKIVSPDGKTIDRNEVKTQRVLPEGVADTEKGILETVISSGTGENASTDGYNWGKTGTTENNGDAWFCGGTEHFTACVWVGHAQTNTPMETDFAGNPVDGGTYPAMIWGQVMQAAEEIYEERQEERAASQEDEEDGGDSDSSDGDSSSSSSGGDGYSGGGSSYGGGSSGGGGSSRGGGGGGGGGSGQSSPAPAPSGGGGGGGGTAGGTGGTGL
jgi:penicillin-binding protein 1A